MTRRRQTHCKYGHEYTPENTAYVNKKKSKRTCRICKRKRDLIYQNNNIEKHRESNRKYMEQKRQSDPTFGIKIANWQKQYRQRNRETVRAYYRRKDVQFVKKCRRTGIIITIAQARKIMAIKSQQKIKNQKLWDELSFYRLIY